MGFIEDVLMGGAKKEAATVEDEAAVPVPVPIPIPIPDLSSVASSVVHRCSRILHLTLEQLQQSFEADFPDCSKQGPNYARNLLEYCSLKALSVDYQHPECLEDRDFSLLTFDMMLAWETPDHEAESLHKVNTCSIHHEVDDDDDGSIFSGSATRMASQVDGKRTVGLEAFARIASSCPAVADPITAHNLFDVLTGPSGGQLHFLIYNKYIKSLCKVLKSIKRTSGSAEKHNLSLEDGEFILDVDGVVPTKSVLQHIGMSTWPGRLTLTTHALYFEALRVGSYDKAVKYDLSKDLRQAIKRELTGPWGARLFDKAVMYKSNSLAEPVFFEFPQFNGHSRRDYWFAVIREILHVHKFIRKFNLKRFQSAEALSRATLGIFRYRALKEDFHIIPSFFMSTLAFNLAEKLPKGDKILEALYDQLQVMQSRHHSHSVLEPLSDAKMVTDTFPDSLYTLIKLGFPLLKNEDIPEEHEFLAGSFHVGQSSQLQRAVKESVCYSGRVVAARATLDQVKVEDIDTNLAVIKELLFPLLQIGKRLQFLATWEDPFKSRIFLCLVLYFLYRGWIRYVLPCILLSTAICMFWHKHRSNGKTIEAFKLLPPPSRSPMEQILTLQELISQLEMNIQIGTIALLKLRALLFAAFPQTTHKVAIALIIVAAAFFFMPFKHLLVLVLLEIYTREMPLRKESSEKLIRRITEWWVRIPAAPVQLIKPQEHKKSRKMNKRLSRIAS